MAFCGNCGTKAVGEFCINCGRPTQAISEPAQPVQAAPIPASVEPIVAAEVITPEPQPVTLPPVVEAEAQVVEAEVPVQQPVQPVALEEVVPKVVEDQTSQLTGGTAETIQELVPAEARRKSSKKIPLIVGGSLIVLAALLFPGSGEVTVTYTDYTSENNPAVDLTLQIEGQDIRIPKDAIGETLYTGTWSSFQASVLRVVPDPKNDEVIEIKLPQLGSLGIWNFNKARTITISAYDGSVDVDISGGDNFSEVDYVSATRSFYERDLATCKEDFNEDFGYAIKLGRNSYTNYLSFVEDSQLDGTRTLLYTTWARRADTLQGKMTGYLSLMDDNSLSTTDANFNSLRTDAQLAFIDLRSAWKNLETVSRNESESKWDAAWTRIYNAETELYNTVDAFAATAKGVGGKICVAELNRE